MENERPRRGELVALAANIVSAVSGGLGGFATGPVPVILKRGQSAPPSGMSKLSSELPFQTPSAPRMIRGQHLGDRAG